ncbi:MAG: sigma-70 family RNA polymerase sigma factor [Bacteroidales bacterium]|nr:sigma-70 family RNA polymerase sigma factor [Bacteroidales bacterium]
MFIKFRHRDSAYRKLSDEELIDRIVHEQNEKATETLFDRYVYLLYGICLKYLKDRDDAKDAVMEAFQHALEKIPAAEIRSFKAWIYTVTKNHCLMQLRKNNSKADIKNKIADFFYSEIMESGNGMNLINEEQETDNEETIEEALTKLKKEQEQCVRLMYLENKSYKEIADITGYTMNEVKSYIQNGKRNLKILITNNNGKKN